jgi:hypothetical protein
MIGKQAAKKKNCFLTFTLSDEPKPGNRMLLEQRFPATIPAGPPLLMVVIDTEEEFDWRAPFNRASTAVTNIAAQSRAQEIFNAVGLRPTYVVDYPVAATAESAAVLRGFVQAGQALIGAHLHPWVNPPHEEEVNAFNSYAGNLPAELEHAKLANLTAAITDAFGIAPRAFKAGRYGLGPHTSAALRALGYTVDLSVVPHTHFRNDGGPDFQSWPDRPFWAGHPGDLLCIPLSRGYPGIIGGPRSHHIVHTWPLVKFRAGTIASRLGITERVTLSPEGQDFAALRRLVRTERRDGHRVFTLTYHSPSLAPGHTPYVRDARAVETFIDTIRRITDHILGDLNGIPTTPQEVRELALKAVK